MNSALCNWDGQVWIWLKCEEWQFVRNEAESLATNPCPISILNVIIELFVNRTLACDDPQHIIIWLYRHQKERQERVNRIDICDWDRRMMMMTVYSHHNRCRTGTCDYCVCLLPLRYFGCPTRNILAILFGLPTTRIGRRCIPMERWNSQSDIYLAQHHSLKLQTKFMY